MIKFNAEKIRFGYLGVADASFKPFYAQSALDILSTVYRFILILLLLPSSSDAKGGRTKRFARN